MDYHNSSRLPGRWRVIGSLLVAFWCSLHAAIALDYDRLMASLIALGGTEAEFREWQRMTNATKELGNPSDKLRNVNEFFNRHFLFNDDQEVWNQGDYWATPIELLAKGRGDCEDFTIAKYFTLLDAGIPDEQLRLVYVKARIGGPNSSVLQAHMVLAYYPSPTAEPLVLDNLITDIRPASRRPDLTPVFSFNSQGIWMGAGGANAKTSGGLGRLSRWQDLLRRARLEGFE